MDIEMRLIDANALCQSLEFAKFDSVIDSIFISEAIKNAPTVDAVEVVHGRWNELDSAADYQCSVCGFRFTSGDPISMFPYCRCGAKMDGGNEDGFCSYGERRAGE